MATVFIGTSGYQYDHWKGRFYPADLPKSRWFEFYLTRFATVEINATFYRLPAKMTFEQWLERAPEWFVYTLKYSRYGTHVKKLKDPAESLGRFLENSAALRPRVGAILVQLPPRWNVNPVRLKEFLQATPSEYRWALEFRDESWLTDEVYEILRDHGAALVIHDHIKPHPEVITTSWVYLRFHGGMVGTGGYSPENLQEVAGSIAGHTAAGRDVYVYFNNDWDGHALHNAADLMRYAQERGVRTHRPPEEIPKNSLVE
jgi:uncharacterized protein YecE (DUF72 family)